MPNCTYLCLASDACLRAGTASITHNTSYTSHSWLICQQAIVKNLPADPFRRPRCSLKSGQKTWPDSALIGDIGLVDHLRPPILMDVWVIANLQHKLGKLFDAGRTKICMSTEDGLRCAYEFPTDFMWLACRLQYK